MGAARAAPGGRGFLSIFPAQRQTPDAKPELGPYFRDSVARAADRSLLQQPARAFCGHQQHPLDLQPHLGHVAFDVSDFDAIAKLAVRVRFAAGLSKSVSRKTPPRSITFDAAL
jgi:hypothetical protein